ncbi:hypothetical protein [Zavarzinia sp.]|uniref:hypothetical protein n=1 Tax=Zavarzinia sp. TaxID=2027920 RepID=UPI00356492DA
MAYPFPVELTIGCRVRCEHEYKGPFTGTLLALAPADRGWPDHGYVLADSDTPDRAGQWRAWAIDVREISRIPDTWTHPMGAARVERRELCGAGPFCIRRDPVRGDWCLMNRADRGFGERCYGHKTIGELLATWGLRLSVEEFDKNRIVDAHDAHGQWWPAQRVAE